jgi:hypothetical protein
MDVDEYSVSLWPIINGLNLRMPLVLSTNTIKDAELFLPTFSKKMSQIHFLKKC